MPNLLFLLPPETLNFHFTLDCESHIYHDARLTNAAIKQHRKYRAALYVSLKTSTHKYVHV